LQNEENNIPNKYKNSKVKNNYFALHVKNAGIAIKDNLHKIKIK
jgi:hypothetical protein